MTQGLKDFTFLAKWPLTLGVMAKLPDSLARQLDQCSFCRMPLVPPVYSPGRGMVACLECAEQHAKELEEQALAHKFLFD